MKVGTKAPNFNLPDKNGELVSLSDLKGDFCVIYFYPKDNTPGCTIEAQQFTVNLPKFRKLKVDIVGVSGGDEKSKTKFCEANKLKVRLLSDPDFAVAKKFGAYGAKKFMGRSYQGIKRMTFILDRERRVVKIFDQVKPATHADEVLDTIKALIDSE